MESVYDTEYEVLSSEDATEIVLPDAVKNDTVSSLSKDDAKMLENILQAISVNSVLETESSDSENGIVYSETTSEDDTYYQQCVNDKLDTCINCLIVIIAGIGVLCGINLGRLLWERIKI